jgi:hypothetical protein
MIFSYYVDSFNFLSQRSERLMFVSEEHRKIFLSNLFIKSFYQIFLSNLFIKFFYKIWYFGEQDIIMQNLDYE